MNWGLENTKFFKESQGPEDVTSSAPKKGEKTYRYFETNHTYGQEIVKLFPRRRLLWESFKSSPGGAGQSPSPSQEGRSEKEAFADYVKAQDPYFTARINELAPVLFFDFVGSAGKEYVLTSITVRTIMFGEFKGGGFCQSEAWYDIELRHVPGSREYPVDKKLRFQGSGRTVLRFWSDNYQPTMGMSPMGMYRIDVTFNFLVDGNKQSVSTGPFEIDV